MKTCTQCREQKSDDAFGKQKEGDKYVLKSKCKSCTNKNRRDARAAAKTGVEILTSPGPKFDDAGIIAKQNEQIAEQAAEIARIKKEYKVDKTVKLEAKIINMVQEKTELRRQLKESLLEYGMYRKLAEEMQTLIQPFDALPPADPKHYEFPDKIIDETLVINLSDGHGDEVVEPHKVGGLETFNFPVYLCRLERYADTIIEWVRNTLTNHRFKRAIVLQNGDMTSGTIHDHEKRSWSGNMLRNSVAIGQSISLFARDLAPHFETIDWICTSGNHGRFTPKKDYDGAWHNWDYLISEIAKMQSANLDNVKFHIPDSWSLCLDIEGHGFYLAHGDDIKSWNSIPYYGIERKTRRLVALHNSIGHQLKYFIFGHFHAMTMAAELKGETIVNGAFPATDTYSYESFSGYREPMQLLFGVHEKQGVSWRLPVKIKDAEAELLGPRRYGVILAQEGFETFS